MVANNRRGCDLPAQVRQIIYGQLLCIINVVMPQSRTLVLEESRRYLLAVIQPCSTAGKDATRQLMTYSETTVPVVVDLHTVECVVGCVNRGNEWGIVDRSGDFARTIFVNPEVEIE
jgi:hypothetical protein